MKNKKTKAVSSNTPKLTRQPSEQMRDFNMFLLGRADLTDREKENILKAKAEKQLIKMLKQKEKSKAHLQKLKSKMSKAQFEVLKVDKTPPERPKEEDSPSGLTPVISSESESSAEEYVSATDSSNEGIEENYKNEAYWQLPANVRHAIDISKKKSKHSDFFCKLKCLNEKISVYKQIFYAKSPKFEKLFLDRKRQRLENMMHKEQRELETFILNKKTEKSPRVSKLKLSKSGSQKQKMTKANYQSGDLHAKEELEEYLGPAGQMRQSLKMSRGFESSFEIQNLTELRSRQLGIQSKNNNGPRHTQIVALKNLQKNTIGEIMEGSSIASNQSNFSRCSSDEHENRFESVSVLPHQETIEENSSRDERSSIGKLETQNINKESDSEGKTELSLSESTKEVKFVPAKKSSRKLVYITSPSNSNHQSSRNILAQRKQKKLKIRKDAKLQFSQFPFPEANQSCDFKTYGPEESQTKKLRKMKKQKFNLTQQVSWKHELNTKVSDSENIDSYLKHHDHRSSSSVFKGDLYKSFNFQQENSNRISIEKLKKKKKKMVRKLKVHVVSPLTQSLDYSPQAAIMETGGTGGEGFSSRIPNIYRSMEAENDIFPTLSSQKIKKRYRQRNGVAGSVSNSFTKNQFCINGQIYLDEISPKNLRKFESVKSQKQKILQDFLKNAHQKISKKPPRKNTSNRYLPKLYAGSGRTENSPQNLKFENKRSDVRLPNVELMKNFRTLN